MAEYLSEALEIPSILKDKIKELMYVIGFQSREEKVKLGIASMDIMYYTLLLMTMTREGTLSKQITVIKGHCVKSTPLQNALR